MFIVYICAGLLCDVSDIGRCSTEDERKFEIARAGSLYC
jgi:hypothetical protein